MIIFSAAAPGDLRPTPIRVGTEPAKFDRLQLRGEARFSSRTDSGLAPPNPPVSDSIGHLPPQMVFWSGCADLVSGRNNPPGSTDDRWAGKPPLHRPLSGETRTERRPDQQAVSELERCKGVLVSPKTATRNSKNRPQTEEPLRFYLRGRRRNSLRNRTNSSDPRSRKGTGTPAGPCRAWVLARGN